MLASASLEVPDPDADPEANPDALATSFSSVETCPACHAEIQFANLRKATCAKGHTWGESGLV